MMSAGRFKQIFSGLSATAGKVYACVPKAEEWTLQMVLSELARQGVNLPHASIIGCLDSLRRSGLVKETNAGFRQVPVRQALVSLVDLKQAITIQTKEVAMPVAKNEVNPVEVIEKLSQEMAAMAQRHQKEMHDLAGRMSDAAIEVQLALALERNSADLGKLHQLKDLLKGIGG